MNSIQKTAQEGELNWLENLKKEIISNIAHPEFDMEFLGERMNLSRRHLQRKIKKITGETPVNFIKELKLKEAKRQIENKEVNSVKELSNKVGFASSDYFSNLFKKRFGESPSELLK